VRLAKALGQGVVIGNAAGCFEGSGRC
jgi:hypothetical protein